MCLGFSKLLIFKLSLHNASAFQGRVLTSFLFPGRPLKKEKEKQGKKTKILDILLKFFL